MRSRRLRGLTWLVLSAWACHVIALLPAPRAAPRTGRLAATATPGQSASSLDGHDVAFMERLRNLAEEALTWEHLSDQQRLVWAAMLELDVVPVQELPPWLLEQQNVTRRPRGVDLLSLDGLRAVRCLNATGSAVFAEVRRFLRVAKWVYKAADCALVTTSSILPKKVKDWLEMSRDQHRPIRKSNLRRLGKSSTLPRESHDDDNLALRPCQTDCLKACGKGARIVEMACGTGKTRVIEVLVRNISGRVLIIVPLLALLDQFALDFPGFCKAGKGHNQKIDFDARGFIAVAPSVQHLVGLKFEAVFVDEAHHPLPSRMPEYNELYRFSATHTDDPDFRYPMGQAIEDGVLCDYDITVPAVTEHHSYVCLADLLSKQGERFRRVLAYCNTVAEAKKFQMVLEELGLAAWHINATTSRKGRVEAIEEFSGNLTKPVHVMVTVEVLGEGINIPNADTCMFVEPRNSYRSVIQAIGRVLRHHPGKTLAHIVLPGVAVPTKVGSEVEAWSKAPHHDLRSAEMEETSGGTVHGRGITDAGTPRPDQAFIDFGLPVANTSKLNKGQRGETPQKYPCRSPPASSTAGVDLVEASTFKDPGVTPQVKRIGKRGGGVRKVEEEHARRKDLDDTAGTVTVGAGQERTGSESLNLAPSSSSSTRSSLTSSLSLLPLEPALPAPTPPSDRSMATKHLRASGEPLQAEPLAEPRGQGHRVGQGQQLHPWEVSDCIPATIEEVIQRDTAVCEQLHDCFIGRANDLMEQQAVKSSAAEVRQRGVSGPSIRRVQLKSHVAVARSDHNELYSSQLERFLSLLVQADSRLVGSSVGHRIQLVDCRISVEGQELNSLTEAVCRRCDVRRGVVKTNDTA